ncbi:helix-turn-helix domain-containing protein [Actinomycetospora flava]|uniref:Helix-turn-helix domain-containing protein n=1 Tax=Actinomycetospora flava TaxID=3129232 RepID=A0ABU8M3S8_9PSEU
MTDEALDVGAVLDLLDAALADPHGGAARIARSLEATDLGAEAARTIADRVAALQRELAQSRRRENELSALFTSARELAELRDVDLLLHRLVLRAHDLIGTDVTYLSVYDPDRDELRVRATAGTVTSEFERLIVPPGVGLAARVVRTRAPQWAARYDTADVPHTDDIDDAVAGEGLVALLGVPMIAGGRETLGVLFAANRYEHGFRPDQVALLSAFADHAAVVLETARLLAQTTASETDARRARDRLAGHVEAMERASVVHERLTGIVLRGGGADEVCDTLATALARPVTILDRDHHVVCGAGTDAPRTADWPDSVRDALGTSRRTGRAVVLREGARPPDIEVVAVVQTADAALGALLVGPGDVGIGAVETRTIERSAQITALLTLRQDALLEGEQRVRGDLVVDLLSATSTSNAELAARARAQGIDPQGLRTLVVLDVPPEHRRHALRVLSRDPGQLAGEYLGTLVALTATTDPEKAAAELRRQVAGAVGGVLAVAAPPADALTELAARFASARNCARLLPHLGIADGAVSTVPYLPYEAVLGAADHGAITAFVDALIGPVVAWDVARGTDLVATMHHYLDEQSSPTRAARSLRVHTNTVLQRLERIDALLGDDWKEGDKRFRVSLAVRLRRITAIADEA